jgi:hypothetical protein
VLRCERKEDVFDEDDITETVHVRFPIHLSNSKVVSPQLSMRLAKGVLTTNGIHWVADKRKWIFDVEDEDKELAQDFLSAYDRCVASSEYVD